MIRKLQLRLLSVGGAKASTNGQDVGDNIESDFRPYP